MDRQQQPQRPAYPSLQTSSQPSSAFHSSNSLSSVSSHGSLLSPTMPSRQQSSAPLPSPTVSHQAHHFGSIHGQQSQQQQQSYSHTQYTQYAQQQQQSQQQRQAQSSISSYQFQPDRKGAGQTAQETQRYLGDFGLVAEAAKRAQIAVLMRDMEGVELR